MWIDALTAHQAQQIRALAQRAHDADGVDPLNEEAYRSLTDGSARHFLFSENSQVVGYLNHSPRFDTTQLLVDPAYRRRGIGTTLWSQLRRDPQLGLWAFADLKPAQGFAAAQHLRAARTLAMMQRSLPWIEVPIPTGLRLRGYRDTDASDLLAVNADAFAEHPEQGQLDADGLAARTGAAWFDPAGLILAFDAGGLVGFHWTKQVDASTGEVYVIAVAPRAQGRGYGKVLLAAGMSHLATQGLTTVVLYVDTADETAVRMYEQAGFATVHRDVCYQPIQEQE